MRGDERKTVLLHPRVIFQFSSFVDLRKWHRKDGEPPESRPEREPFVCPATAIERRRPCAPLHGANSLAGAECWSASGQ
jgi:hypothetical protein